VDLALRLANDLAPARTVALVTRRAEHQLAAAELGAEAPRLAGDLEPLARPAARRREGIGDLPGDDTARVEPADRAVGPFQDRAQQILEAAAEAVMHRGLHAAGGAALQPEDEIEEMHRIVEHHAGVTPGTLEAEELAADPAQPAERARGDDLAQPLRQRMVAQHETDLHRAAALARPLCATARASTRSRPTGFSMNTSSPASSTSRAIAALTSLGATASTTSQSDSAVRQSATTRARGCAAAARARASGDGSLMVMPGSRPSAAQPRACCAPNAP
jgi:hypothetical protein